MEHLVCIPVKEGKEFDKGDLPSKNVLSTLRRYTFSIHTVGIGGGTFLKKYPPPLIEHEGDMV